MTNKEFKPNGCTAFWEGPWSECCNQHDLDYHNGGSLQDRLAADKRLRECMRAKGYRKLAILFYYGVRLLGGNFWPKKLKFGRFNRRWR